ncbi:MAG TPA: LLM class F420-dependent oxidoreductase [Mycobacteriales bacterium]|nr:LLM class F420-dependent oxidoreductase [Mycobacteriales bacterium]
MQSVTGTGVWAAQLRYGDAGAIREMAVELEELGYSALWIPDVGGDVFASVELLMDATKQVIVATGILNLWMHSAEETAQQHARLSAAHGDRFLVGIGVSHQPLIDRKQPGRYTKPLTAMREYLDGLDAADRPLSRDHRILAALGPRMLELARDRSGGAHPYNVTPEHTALARGALGPEALVATEQAVALSTDASVARAAGRQHLSIYLDLPNYTNNLRRLGFADEDFAEGGSDRLVDALVAWGDESAIAQRVQEHRDAGADHVCIQVVNQDAAAPADQWRALAPALVG